MAPSTWMGHQSLAGSPVQQTSVSLAAFSVSFFMFESQQRGKMHSFPGSDDEASRAVVSGSRSVGETQAMLSRGSTCMSGAACDLKQVEAEGPAFRVSSEGGIAGAGQPSALTPILLPHGLQRAHGSQAPQIEPISSYSSASASLPAYSLPPRQPRSYRHLVKQTRDHYTAIDGPENLRWALLECTLPYLLRKGNGPCTTEQDSRCPGPCMV